MNRRASRTTRTAARRRRRHNRRVLLTTVAALLLGAGGVAVSQRQEDGAARSAPSAEPPGTTPSRTPPVTPGRTVPTVPTAAPETTPPAESSGPAPSVPVPRNGPGTFSASRVAGERQGCGRARTYRVEVEDGVALDPDEAARTVAAVLGDRRGWTRNPAYGFRLVASGPVDFTVRVATPGTTDRLCHVTTPSSKGNVNCRIDHSVVVNLKLWVRGSPRFDGPIEVIPGVDHQPRGGARDRPGP